MFKMHHRITQKLFCKKSKKPKPPKEKKPKKKDQSEEKDTIIMAFTKTPLPVSRYGFFTFHATGNCSAISQDLAFSTAVELHEIRIHLSSAASVADLIATLSGSSVSVYDHTLFSKAMNGLTEYIWKPTDSTQGPKYLNKGETLTFSFVLEVANVHGLTVQGWSITES